VGDELTASGLWKHPRNRAAEYNDINYWVDFAKVLERGKFHGLFIADVLSHYGVYKGAGNIDPSLASASQMPVADPSCVSPVDMNSLCPFMC
jgi:alkanesulfonate monooxygenase SsuD/methylene tetrahydromethanopterin reductase-like flavin-dependent oxidoreductase (luciferase family)